MLKIKCFEGFDNGYSQILISGEAEDYLRAANYLRNKEHTRLDDPNFAAYYESKFVSLEQLYINEQECKDLAEMFERFGRDPSRGHDYYSTKALKNISMDISMDIMISIGEYSDAIFEEED